MARTFPQNRAIWDRRKKEISEAALFLFATKGFQNVTSDNISDLAKCSHGLIYHYYINVADIFRKIEKRILEAENSKYFIRMKDLADEGGKAIKKLLSFFHDVCEGPQEVVNYYAALAMDDFDFLNTPSEFYGSEDKLIFRKIVKDAVEEGVLRAADPNEIATLFIDALAGRLFRRVRYRGDKVSLETYNRVLC